MNKDTNIRVFKEDLEMLRKISKREGRTLKSMFKVVLKYWKEENDQT